MVGVTTMAAMMELDPSKFVLNEDIRNMFNELDRCSMMEDLLDSAALIGEDFSGLAPYVYMAYFGDYINWFRVVEADTTGLGAGAEGEADDGADVRSEGAGGQRKLTEQARWRAILSAAGVRQGGPLSCFLAALGLVKPMLAARKAIDDYNGVVRVPAPGAVVSAADRKAMAERASRLGEVVGYLDDGSFSARPGALACAHEAYSDACATRNWQVVERKSLMTGELHEGKAAHPLYATAAEGGPATGGGARTCPLSEIKEINIFRA